MRAVRAWLPPALAAQHTRQPAHHLRHDRPGGAEGVCSGRGLCFRGRCACDEGYSGTACERRARAARPPSPCAATARCCCPPRGIAAASTPRRPAAPPRRRAAEPHEPSRMSRAAELHAAEPPSRRAASPPLCYLGQPETERRAVECALHRATAGRSQREKADRSDFTRGPRRPPKQTGRRKSVSATSGNRRKNGGQWCLFCTALPPLASGEAALSNAIPVVPRSESAKVRKKRSWLLSRIKTRHAHRKRPEISGSDIRPLPETAL